MIYNSGVRRSTEFVRQHMIYGICGMICDMICVKKRGIAVFGESHEGKLRRRVIKESYNEGML